MQEKNLILKPKPFCMDKLLKPSRILFAASIAMLGVLNFISANYIVGRPPAITWPSWAAQLPGKFAWAYISGAFFIFASLLIIFKIKVYWSALSISTVILVYSFLLRHVPAMSDITNEYKSLALAGGAFIIASSVMDDKASHKFSNLFFTGILFVSWFLIFCGIEHFKFDEFVSTLVPSYFSHPYFWTYFAAVVLIAGGIGMLYKPTRKLAALLCGIMVLLWCCLLHIPRALTIPARVNYPYGEWMGVAETICLSGAFFTIAALTSKEKEIRQTQKEEIKKDIPLQESIVNQA